MNGKATQSDVEALGRHVEKLLRDNDTSWRAYMAAGSVCTAVYFFEEDLTLCRMYTETTRAIARPLPHFLLRPDGALRDSILEELGHQDIGDYFADGLALELLGRMQAFYEGGIRTRLASERVLYAQCVAKLPPSSRRDRLLLNYPFEPATAVWMAYADPEAMQPYYDTLPQSWWRPPDNIFKWYYLQVIQKAGLEMEFMRELELRNMAHLIPDELRPKEKNKQDSSNGCADCPD